MAEGIRIIADQNALNASKEHTSRKKMGGASISTSKRGVKKEFLDVTALIRSIQRAEGNPDCFGRVEGHCAQMDCAWRTYCLEGQQTSKGK